MQAIELSARFVYHWEVAGERAYRQTSLRCVGPRGWDITWLIGEGVILFSLNRPAADNSEPFRPRASIRKMPLLGWLFSFQVG